VPDDPVHRPADAAERESMIRLLESQMQAAAEALDFELAALLRDQLLELKAGLEPRGGRRAPARGRAQPVR
jgi:excinuclease UvrABC helicase subunit UvrB